MIQVGTNVKVTDNTGAKTGKVFKVLGDSKRRYAQIGDIVVLSVKTAEPRKLLKKKEVVRGIVVRQRRPFSRKDGSYIAFDDNAIVVIDKESELRGGRVFGPIPREVGERGFQKIVSLAPEVL